MCVCGGLVQCPNYKTPQKTPPNPSFLSTQNFSFGAIQKQPNKNIVLFSCSQDVSVFQVRYNSSAELFLPSFGQSRRHHPAEPQLVQLEMNPKSCHVLQRRLSDSNKKKNTKKDRLCFPINRTPSTNPRCSARARTPVFPGAGSLPALLEG